ncbi:MAG: leucine-rich repeat protein [Oscillospiraceae bacterium]|nr:leucine-rich repeat protein [Oscillospiraceae bacterium]
MLLDGTHCTGDFTVPDGITYICGKAFEDSEITSVSLPDSVQEFGFGAFSGCKNLTDFTIPDGVTDIVSCMFSGCRNLKKVTIPESVKIIHNGAFDFCYGLTEFTVPENIESVDNAFDYCENLKTLTFENPECLITPDNPHFYSMSMSIVVRGYADSTAYWFAYMTGRKFEKISKTGDTNSDGIVNTADAVMLQKWLVRSDEITDINAADVCSDAKINVFDLCALKHMIKSQN